MMSNNERLESEMAEKDSKATVFAHVESAIKALILEAYSMELDSLSPLDHVTISEDLKRVDCAIGPKGESVFARIADRIDETYVELLALREALHRAFGKDHEAP